MAYPSTLNNTNAAHSAGQAITSADENVQSVDINALGVKVGTGAGTPTSGLVLTGGTSAGSSSWQAASGWVVYAGTPASTGAAAANVTAWNTAVTALPAAGGTIFVKAGVYYINGNLAIARSHVKVLAEPGAIFKLGAAANCCMLVLGTLGGTSVTDIDIDGLELDGSGATQTLSGVSGWEATFENMACVARQVYRLTIRNCYIHDVWSTGIESNRCGQVAIVNNTVDNVGLKASAGTRNGISVIGPSNDAANFPSELLSIIGNRVRRYRDVGIDAHGSGSYYVSIVGNQLGQSMDFVTGGGIGILIEIEQADTLDNVGTVISGNVIDKAAVALDATNTGNALRNFAAMSITGNVVTNCLAGMYAEGHQLVIVGNSLWNVQCGISTNNATAVGFDSERDWVIANNAILIDPTFTGFGAAGIFLRWQAAAAAPATQLATGAITGASNAAPIVLTVPGWTRRPSVGQVVVVATVNGNTAANGTWVVQQVNATQVTLKGSIGNGAFTTSGSSTVKTTGRMLDSISIEGNTLTGAGTGNTQGTHSGIYIEALYAAPNTTSVSHINIGPNVIHSFEHGLTISGNAPSAIGGVSLRGVKAWENNSYGLNLLVGAGAIDVIDGCDFVGNGLGAVTGLTAGQTGNIGAVRDTIGITPAGRLTLPMGSIPATPVASTTYINNTGYDATVYIVAGTSVAVSIGGVATGLGTGVSYLVAAGQTINLGAFTGSPTWVWFA